ncbi:MAG: DUF3887 domain-containing protein [Clostridia bacterium]|nr:DUF3887 domain-containing protein [Clostridia bacterium]
MQRRIRRLAAIMAAALCLGCAGLAPLDARFDEEALKERAAEVVRLASAGAYGEVCALLREDLAGELDAAALEAAWSPALDAAGELVEIAKIRCGGTEDAAGEPFAVAVVNCRCRHGQLIYTLSFDGDMALVGLYLR